MTSKTDKILEECWSSHPNAFGLVNKAVSELLTVLVDCATFKGVSTRVATDTYLDWIRSRMETADFMS